MCEATRISHSKKKLRLITQMRREAKERNKKQWDSENATKNHFTTHRCVFE